MKLVCISVSDFFNDYITIHDIYIYFNTHILIPVLIKNVNIFNCIHYVNNCTHFIYFK